MYISGRFTTPGLSTFLRFYRSLSTKLCNMYIISGAVRERVEDGGCPVGGCKTRPVGDTEDNEQGPNLQKQNQSGAGIIIYILEI